MRQPVEIYTGNAPPDTMPRCIAKGCMEPITAKLFIGDYGTALAGFGIRRRGAGRSKRADDMAVFVCERHMADAELNERMIRPRWQWLLRRDEECG